MVNIFKKFKLNIVNVNYNNNNFSTILNKNKALTVEQFANVTNLIFFSQDNTFYWYQRKNITSTWIVYKIWHSYKLRTLLLKNLQEIWFSNFFIIIIFNFKNKILQNSITKSKFLNWWGWKKMIVSFMQFFMFYELFYLYKFTATSKFFKYLKKSILKNNEIICYNVLNVVLNKNYTFYLKQIWNFETFQNSNFSTLQKEKLTFFWKFPRIKLEICIKEFNFLNKSFLKVEAKILKLNLFWFLLKDLNIIFNYNAANLNLSFFFGKILLNSYEMFLNSNSFTSTAINITAVNYFILFLKSSFSVVFKDIYLYFLEKLKLTYSAPKIEFLNLTNLNFSSIILPTSYLRINYTGVERFLKSYLFKWKIKKKTFIYFQGLSKDYYKQNVLTAAFFYNFLFSINFNLIFLEKYQYTKISQYWKFFFLKKKFLSFPITWFLNLFLFQVDNFQTKLSPKTEIIKGDRLKINFFYFDFIFIKKFLYFYNCLLNYSLSFLLNYSLYFNKYYNLDSFSSLKVIFFFYNPTYYNIVFFHKKLYNFNFLKLLIHCKLIFNFEIGFFRKKFLFWGVDNIFTNFNRAFITYLRLLKYLATSTKKKVEITILPNYWFDFKLFKEELENLALESIFTDYERVQELIWISQLAELRLVKLTNFLKKMWSLNIDVGNVQYSPDFTQHHELGLALKWGLELELLRFTRLIILWRFFGKGWKFFKINFLKKKINFLYNFWKLKLKTSSVKDRETSTTTWVFKTLNLKNIYEFTRLQLATIVACYRNVYKNYYYQLTTIHKNYSFNNENNIKNLYYFIHLIYEWQFFITSYKKYYLKTWIKWKIWFFKMINKNVYKKFTLRTNFFYTLTHMKNSFNYYFFLFFWWLKKNINKKIKTYSFYNLIFLLISKYFWTYYLPSTKTLDDFWFYVAARELFAPRGSKYCLLWKKNKISKIYWNIQFLTFKSQININVNLNFICLFNCDFFSWVKFYNFTFFSFLPISTPNDVFFNYQMQNFYTLYLTFFSEFVYDQLIKFFSQLKFLNLSNKNNNLLDYWLYQTISSNNFSFSLFHFLNKNTFTISTLKHQQQIKLLMTLFTLQILSKKILNNFILNLKKYIICQTVENNEKQYYYSFLVTTSNFIKFFFKNKKTWKKVVSQALFWLMQNFKSENFDIVLQNLLFNGLWLNTFANNLEQQIILFVAEFSKLIFKN